MQFQCKSLSLNVTSLLHFKEEMRFCPNKQNLVSWQQVRVSVPFGLMISHFVSECLSFLSLKYSAILSSRPFIPFLFSTSSYWTTEQVDYLCLKLTCGTTGEDKQRARSWTLVVPDPRPRVAQLKMGRHWLRLHTGPLEVEASQNS